MLQSHHLISHFSRLPLFPPSPSRRFLPRTSSAASRTHDHQLRTVRPAHVLCLAQMGEPEAAAGGGGEVAEEGPVLLPPSTSSSIFATTDDPSPLQVSTSVLLTGAISVFLFRSLRRRAKRSKEMVRVRSTGVTKAKGLKEEAMESLKTIGAASIEPGTPPSPVQALLGGIAAGVIAVILYKFTTTIEASLNRQAISDNFSVRQITITIRTIVNGLCYLATFVFGINAVGLVLYSGQLAVTSLMEPSTSISTPGQNKEEEQGQPDTTEPPKASGRESGD
ncbi:hypothetical protein Taro_002331 [Colocasia esculenta]|uniref:Uncharacterized protein n=1 Tax=Colocasia esculenta TaxID=4460 RepID=A0A843TCE9_COLES|nr:hypothetical protein [Colocasia esculenta]